MHQSPQEDDSLRRRPQDEGAYDPDTEPPPEPAEHPQEPDDGPDDPDYTER